MRERWCPTSPRTGSSSSSSGGTTSSSSASSTATGFSTGRTDFQLSSSLSICPRGLDQFYGCFKYGDRVFYRYN